MRTFVVQVSRTRVSNVPHAQCVLGELLVETLYSPPWPAIIKYGRLIHISERHLQRTELWFARRGELAVFIGRILPIVRTFISLPAGISRMPVWRFVLYTAIGSLPWVYLLTWAGVKLGRGWEHTGRFMHPFTYLVAAGIVIALGTYILKKRKARPFRAE